MSDEKNRSVKKDEVVPQKPDDDAPQNPFRTAAGDDKSQGATVETISHDEIDLKTASEDQAESAEVKFV